MIKIFVRNLIEKIQYNTGGCPVPCSVRPSKILHPTCSAYISFNYGRILMFKVSKQPYQSPPHDRMTCK